MQRYREGLIAPGNDHRKADQLHSCTNNIFWGGHVHKLDDGRQRFRQLVAGAIESKPALPLVHGSDAFKFLNAIADGELRPQPCDVFSGESLLYFFYGRPSYRSNPDAEPTSLAHYLPILLILRSDLSGAVRRIFPFDSGAYERGFYAAHVHHGMKIGDFGLDADSSTPGKLITAFFGDTASYLRAEPGAAAELPPEQMEAVSYRSLVSSRSANSLDSRGAAIELQSASSVSLTEQVQAVILPAPFVEKGGTASELKALGIQAIPYMVHGRTRPSEYVTTITDLCYRYYVEIGLFEPGVINADS